MFFRASKKSCKRKAFFFCTNGLGGIKNILAKCPNLMLKYLLAG